MSISKMLWICLFMGEEVWSEHVFIMDKNYYNW